MTHDDTIIEGRIALHKAVAEMSNAEQEASEADDVYRVAEEIEMITKIAFDALGKLVAMAHGAKRDANAAMDRTETIALRVATMVSAAERKEAETEEVS